jgi:hypothetical protein
MQIPRRNRRAVAVTIRALKAGGLLEPCDEALSTLARVSADTLDEALAFGTERLYAVSGMMRSHLLIVEALVARATSDAESDEELAELLAALDSMRGDASEAG